MFTDRQNIHIRAHVSWGTPGTSGLGTPLPPRTLFSKFLRPQPGLFRRGLRHLLSGDLVGALVGLSLLTSTCMSLGAGTGAVSLCSVIHVQPEFRIQLFGGDTSDHSQLAQQHLRHVLDVVVLVELGDVVLQFVHTVAFRQ